MSSLHQFLLIDLHMEGRDLMSRTLLRKFPGATILESDDADQALAMARVLPLTAIVAHRTLNVSGAELVQQLRAANPTVPILMVSGINREDQARAAGANQFLSSDEWLRLGTVMETLLAQTGRPRLEPQESGSP